MPTKKKTRVKPDSDDNFDSMGVVGRAIGGMTRRLEKGDKPFSEHECRLFVALIQVQNNKNLMNDKDLLDDWDERFKQIENWINTRQTVQAAARPQRRPPGIQGAAPFDGNTQR